MLAKDWFDDSGIKLVVPNLKTIHKMNKVQRYKLLRKMYSSGKYTTHQLEIMLKSE